MRHSASSRRSTGRQASNRTTGKQTIVTLPVAIATEDEVREIMARDEADQIRTF